MTHPTIQYCIEIIDKRRRDICVKQARTKNSIKWMYLEGQRVALEESQQTLLEFKRITSQ